MQSLYLGDTFFRPIMAKNVIQRVAWNIGGLKRTAPYGNDDEISTCKY